MPMEAGDVWHRQAFAYNVQKYARGVALLLDVVNGMDMWKELFRKYEPHVGDLNPLCGFLMPPVKGNEVMIKMLTEMDATVTSQVCWGTEIMQHDGPPANSADWLKFNHRAVLETKNPTMIRDYEFLRGSDG